MKTLWFQGYDIRSITRALAAMSEMGMLGNRIDIWKKDDNWILKMSWDHALEDGLLDEITLKTREYQLTPVAND